MKTLIAIKSLSKFTLLLFFSLALLTSCIHADSAYYIDSEKNMAILGTEEDGDVIYVNSVATLFFELAIFFAMFLVVIGGDYEKTYAVTNAMGRLIGEIHTGKYEHIDGVGFGGLCWFCITAVLMHLIPIIFWNNLFFQLLFGATPVIAGIIAALTDGCIVTDSLRKVGIVCFIILCVILLASIIHYIWPQSALGDFIKGTVEVILTIGR